MLDRFWTRIRNVLLRRPWTWSWWLSLCMHLVVGSCLVLYWLNRLELPEPDLTRSLEIQGGFSVPAESQIQEILIESPSDRQDRSELLRDIREQMKLAQQRGDQDSIERLKQLSADLRRNSTKKTVDEMTEFFGGVFGKRASEPDLRKINEEFDVSTAQMHDISKFTDETGLVQYVLIMVDAKGVAREVQIDNDNGQRLYKTMELIKSNPLLEKVYRNILMGILDQVLKEQASKDPSETASP